MLPHLPRPNLIHPTVAIASLISYMLSINVVCLHFDGMPVLKKCMVERYAKVRVLGRWVFLTRWCIAFQFWHTTASTIMVLLPDSSTIIRITAAMSPIISTIGLYTTIMFFLLLSIRGGGGDSPMRIFIATTHPRLMYGKVFLHMVPGILSILDVVVVQPEYIGYASCRQITLPILLFTICYFLLLHVNYQCTGVWPYGFMNNIPHRLSTWWEFFTGQCCALSGVLVLIYCMRILKPKFEGW